MLLGGNNSIHSQVLLMIRWYSSSSLYWCEEKIACAQACSKLIAFPWPVEG